MNEPENPSDAQAMRMSFGVPRDAPKGTHKDTPEPAGRAPRPGPAPFAVLALADFGGTAGPGAPAAVTRETFDAVLAARRVRFDVEVDNRLGGKPRRLVVSLAPEALSDFTPAGLVQAVPDLARLHALWRAVAAPGAGPDTPEVAAALSACAGREALEEAANACRRALAPAHPAPGPAPAGGPERSGALDRLLGMVGTPAAPAAPGAAGAGGAAADLEGRLAAQVSAILHEPRFRALEAAWRGLRMLLWAVDPRGGARVWLLDLAPDAWGPALADGGPAADLHDGPEGPLSLVVADLTATVRVPDLDRLQELAEAAEGLQVPLVAGLDSGFFGAPGHEADRLPFLGTVLDEATYAPWRALRGKAASRWLAVAYDRPLLRAPYAPEDRKAAGLAERIGGPESLPWGNPAWAMAALTAAAYDRDGWGTGLTATRDGGLSGLPLWGPPGGAAQIPLEAALPDKVLRDVADAGAIPLACRPNRDHLFAPRAPMVHKPDTYDDPGANEAARAMSRLPYQLLATRVTAALARHLAGMPEGLPAAEAAPAVEAFLADLLATTGDGAGATVTAGDGVLEVEARPGRDAPVGAIRLRLPWGASG